MKTGEGKMKADKTLARIAYYVTRNSGGSVTFEEYDKNIEILKMCRPQHWCLALGWGLFLHLRTQRRLRECADLAIQQKLLLKTTSGYKITKQKIR